MGDASKLAADERVAVAAGHIERRVGPLCFVLAPDGQMHSFDNATAVDVWDQLAAAGDAGISPRELAKSLSERFAVDEIGAIDDVQAMLDALVLHCVVRRVG